VAEDPRGNSLGRGTEIVLRLKEDAKEFADFATLKRIVTKYSEFINFPIYIEEVKEIEKEVEVPADEEKKDAEEKKEEDGVEVSEEKKDEKPKMEKVKETVRDWIQVNEQKPIWTRNPKDVTEEEYTNFYKSMTKDSDGPLTHIHFVAEGDVSFRALLYIPKKAPANMYDNYYGKSSAIKLFVRRVLIAEEFEELMPRYLSFVRGVVESDDLPLNVNRETLQKSKLLQVIGKKLVQKALSMINAMVESDAEATDSAEKQYETFWGQFGKSIRLGLIEDHSKNGKKLSKLLRFPSTQSETPIALQTYVDRMKKSQDAVYYIAGESVAIVKGSPFLEKLTKKGYEVLFMTDPLDEHAVQQVTEFDGKKLQSITKEGVSLGKSSDKAKQKLDEAVESLKPLCEYLQKLYGTSKVEKVVVTDRVVSSPAILSTAQYGWSANMERIMKAQALNDASKSSHMLAKRTLELNYRHPIIQELQTRVAADADDVHVKDLARLLYDAAALNSGFAVDDSKDFGDRVYRVLAQGLNVKGDVKVDDEPEEAEEEPAGTHQQRATSEISDSVFCLFVCVCVCVCCLCVWEFAILSLCSPVPFLSLSFFLSFSLLSPFIDSF
jgi:heat shock protein beta